MKIIKIFDNENHQIWMVNKKYFGIYKKNPKIITAEELIKELEKDKKIKKIYKSHKIPHLLVLTFLGFTILK